MTDGYRDQVWRLAADVLGEPLARISDQSSPETVETWDSLQHLNLVLGVEEAFNLQLAPEEIEQVKNIGDLVRVVESKTGTVS